jgi:hypothetical protein
VDSTRLGLVGTAVITGVTVPMPHGYLVDAAKPGGRGSRGRALDDGGAVVVRSVPADAVAAIRANAAAVGWLRSPHVAALREVCFVGEVAVVVRDWVDGTPLEVILDRRESLTAGEVTTLLVPLARVLADVHRHGAVHGALSPGNVVVAVDGRPVLTDGFAAAASREADWTALFTLAARALGRGATGRIADVLRSGAVGDELATALLAACPPAPIAATGVAASEPAVVGASSPVHRARTAVVGVLAIALAVGVAAATAGHASPRPRTAAARSVPAARAATVAPTGDPQADPVPTVRSRWLPVVRALEQRRAGAYARGDADLLSQVYVAGSELLRADTGQLREQLGADGRARGLRAAVLGVHLVSAMPQRVELDVVDAWSAYDVVRDGRVLRHGAGRSPRRIRMVLRRTAAGWRIGSVG